MGKGGEDEPIEKGKERTWKRGQRDQHHELHGARATDVSMRRGKRREGRRMTEVERTSANAGDGEQEAAAELTARRNVQDLWEQQQQQPQPRRPLPGATDGGKREDASIETKGIGKGREGTSEARSEDVNATKETKARLFQLTTRVSRFRRQVERLGTTQDTSKLRRRIREDRESISDEAKELAQVLKQNNRETSVSATRSERAGQERLLEDLKGVLRDFQEAQLARVHKESSTVPVDEEDPPSPSTWLEGQGDPRETEDTYPDLEEQALLQQQQKARKEELDHQIRQNEAIIQERDRGIQEIQNEIGEVNEIFADLAVLVQQQGGMIDDIEANVVSAAGRTGEAVVELRKAERNQRRSRGRLCIVMMIFGLVLLVVIITARR